MDDRKLETLLTTVKEGSFSKAAEKLHCSQSAVTQLMNSFEDELGCKVLTRKHNGVTLTRAGEQLLPLIIKADHALGEVKRQAEYIQKGLEMPLRIGTFASVANQWLPKLIGEYQKLYPEISFDLRIGTSAVASWMTAGEIDVAFADEECCRGFRFYPLHKDRFYAVMPEDMGPDTESITQEEFICYPYIKAPETTLGRYLNRTPEKGINVFCDDDSALLRMVAQGLGVTIIPEMSLIHTPERVKILDLEPEMTRTMGISVQPSADKRVTEFVTFVRRYFDTID